MLAGLRAVLRAIMAILIIFSIGAIQSCLMWLPRRAAFYFFPQLLCKLALRALNIKLEIRGEISRDVPTLFLANHASYLDIIVLQAAIKASFISKEEVANWPVFGWLAHLQDSIFIKRVRHEAKNQTDAIADRLKAGGNLILFPEGTTGDGCRILPVKSSLLGVAPLAKALQPVTVAFTALDGLPPGRTFRYMYAWVGDEGLPPHMLRVLMMGDMTVRVTFHEPIRDSLDNRKALAGRIEKVLRTGLNAALTGQIA